MIVLGITGGIGSGKSTAAGYLAGLGFACVDADQIGRDITADGSPMLKDINDQFGPGAPMGNGTEFISVNDKGIDVLDRKALASVVFRDPEIRKAFDQLVQRKIIDIIDQRILELKVEGTARGVLLDAPLMFEAGCDSLCDKVILITAHMETRIARVIERDNTSEEDVRMRIANQMSDEEKAALSDYVVDNSNEPEHMFARLDEIIKELEI